MNMKNIIVILTVVILVVVLGGYLIYYLNLPAPIRVIPQDELEQFNNENPTNTTSHSNVEAEVISRGDFIRVDIYHYAEGEATVKLLNNKPVLELNSFTVADGPDLFIYMSKESGLTTLTPDPGEFISLGRLKATKGIQQYNLPEDYSDYKSVLIWCRAFGVMFSSADLQ